ncbi:MAG: hypothetical protein AAAC48_19910 [Phyllobacterium sp.]|uniref:hypothetical protein n=1 Tax=Phyllobacterium sp. TaxID=1871046 RepID=UPI0030F0A141
MRLYVATAIAAVSFVCTAQADQKLDNYRRCWANASAAVISTIGTSARSLSYAVFIANAQCQSDKVRAMATNSLADVKWVAEQLVIKLHNANHIQEAAQPEASSVDVASTAPKQD